MTSNFDGQGIGDGFPGAVLVFDPSWKRQRNPYGPAIDQKLDIHGIGMPCGDGYDQRLKHAVHFLLRPAVERMKILVHPDSISEHGGSEQTAPTRASQS